MKEKSISGCDECYSNCAGPLGATNTVFEVNQKPVKISFQASFNELCRKKVTSIDSSFQRIVLFICCCNNNNITTLCIITSNSGLKTWTKFERAVIIKNSIQFSFYGFSLMLLLEKCFMKIGHFGAHHSSGRAR